MVHAKLGCRDMGQMSSLDRICTLTCSLIADPLDSMTTLAGPAPAVVLALADGLDVPANPTAWVAAAWLVVWLLKWARDERREMQARLSPAKSTARDALHHRTTDEMAEGVDRLELIHQRSDSPFSNQIVLDKLADHDAAATVRHNESLGVLKSIDRGIEKLAG